MVHIAATWKRGSWCEAHASWISWDFYVDSWMQVLHHTDGMGGASSSIDLYSSVAREHRRDASYISATCRNIGQMLRRGTNRLKTLPRVVVNLS